METKYKQQCTDVLHNCRVLSKGHLSDKTKTRYPGKRSILLNNWNTQEKMAIFGAHKPFSPSATEAARLKVSIKQGFYLKMYCPHSPLHTLKEAMLQTLTAPEPCVLCTAVWAQGQVHLTQKLLLPPALLDGKTHYWCQVWKSFQEVLGKQKLQHQQTLCQVMGCHHWAIPTWIFLAYYCSLEENMLSPLLSALHSCQNLCDSWDPSGYKIVLLRGLS